MEVRSDFRLRQSEKLFPGKSGWPGNFAGNPEVPIGFVKARDAAVVEYRPFERERLAGREAALGARLVLKSFAVAAIKQGQGLLD